MARTAHFPRMVIEACHAMAHDLFRGGYHPEQHYMRGPGPKCREKRNAAEQPQQVPAHADVAHA